MAEKFQWPDIKIDSLGEEVFCYGLRNQIGILVDGTVVPCCLDNNGDIEYNDSKYSLVTELVIPNTVTNIGSAAFSNCSSLSSVIVPASVASIGAYAFCRMKNLKTV